MNAFTIILGAVIEIVALVFVVRLWRRRPRRLAPCVLWSVVLLVPFLGVPIYVFLRDAPEPHADDQPATWGD